MKNEFTPEQKQMLAAAAEKLGIPQAKLEESIRNGNVGALLQGNARLAALLSDKKMLEQLMNSPQARALMTALLKKN